MTDANEMPIACTLAGRSYDARLEWIAALNADGLVSHRRDGRALELCYRAAVRDRVDELVRQESTCCAFLAFDLEDAGDGVRLTITVPPRAGDVAGDVLAPFLAGVAAGSPSDNRQ